ncbi:MAG: ABC transporter ATP-binding protein, partial [bacterium]
MSSNHVIEFKNVTKRYYTQGQRTLKELIQALVLRRESPGQFLIALEDFTLTLNKGESLGVIGRNGAGKSTLLKLIAGVTSPTVGSIVVSGRIAPLIELGAGFHPELTGRENVYLNAAMFGMNRPEIEEKFNSIVKFSELKNFIDTPVKYYSSGMYLRLAFAVAIHVDADIILIDEILAVGDEKFQQKCLARLNKLKDEGITIIYISHNIQSVLDFCERGVYLKNGKTAVIGP